MWILIVCFRYTEDKRCWYQAAGQTVGGTNVLRQCELRSAGHDDGPARTVPLRAQLLHSCKSSAERKHPKPLLYNTILIVYRMEFDKTRWSCSWNSDQNCAQNFTRVTFCLSKTGPCVVILSEISSQFTREVVHYLLCMLLLLCFFVVRVVQYFGSKWDKRFLTILIDSLQIFWFLYWIYFPLCKEIPDNL